MNQRDYDRWWALHLRASRGEALSDEERNLYQNGLASLHLSESLQPALLEVQAARRTVTELKQQQASLRERRDELDSEISEVEEALSQSARQLLDAKD